MPTQHKILTVANLAEKLKSAKAVVLTDYRGLSVPQMQELRRKIKAAGGEFEVTKNTLLGKAAAEAGVGLEGLAGPTATLFAYEDEIATFKSLVDFTKDAGLPQVKFALMGKSPLSPDRLIQLASLPSREALLAQLLSVLSRPAAGLANALTWNSRRLVASLKEIREKK